MTDAPERIWAGNWLADVGETSVWDIGEWRDEPWQTVDTVEYVRATDYDALAAKLDAAERRERQLLDTTATCRMLRREFNTLKAKLAEVEAERDAFASNIPDAAQNLIRNAHTGRLKALHRAKAAEAELARADLATPLDDPRVVALVEAGKGVVDEYYNQVHSPVIYNIRHLEAALSALEENK